MQKWMHLRRLFNSAYLKLLNNLDGSINALKKPQTGQWRLWNPKLKDNFIMTWTRGIRLWLNYENFNTYSLQIESKTSNWLLAYKLKGGFVIIALNINWNLSYSAIRVAQKLFLYTSAFSTKLCYAT